MVMGDVDWLKCVADADKLGAFLWLVRLSVTDLPWQFAPLSDHHEQQNRFHTKTTSDLSIRSMNQCQNHPILGAFPPYAREDGLCAYP